MTGPERVLLDDLDLAAHVREGDTVLWGQTCAEPLPLTRMLMEQRHSIGPFRCFLGMPVSDTCGPEHADVVSFVSYCGSGPNRELDAVGALDLLPVHYSDLPQLFATGRLRIDVLLLLTGPPGEDGCYPLAVADEYLSAAIDGARVVIAEVSDRVPRSVGGRRIPPERVDVVVPTSRSPLELPARASSPAEEAIAARVAELVPDGATLQFGLGSLPSAILRRLSGHRDLGVHSGMIGDAVADLMESGVINGARKTVDRAVTVAGVLMGTERLFGFADGRPDIHLRDTGYTHDATVLAAQHRFVAINAALEVDLTGQINSESVHGSYLGAVGGAVDFIRGAHRSVDGVPITALPSTAGVHSRVVAQLNGPVSTARSDAGIVVTEHGIADLRGLSIPERRERMLAIADPAHRPALIAQLDDIPATVGGAP